MTVAGRTPGYAAAAWSVVFAAVHVFWALGGRAGLASSAGDDLAATRPVWFVLIGLWGTAAVLVAAACVALAASGRRGSGDGRRWARIVAGLVATVLVLRGLGVELLLLADAEVSGAVGPAERTASLWVWNPWFLLGGVLFALAAWRRRSVRPRGDAV